MNSKTINANNFLLFAAQNYKPSYADFTEFKEDINRIKYLKKLLYRYKNDNDLQTRLILNHVIVLYNVFGAHAASQIILYKLEDYLPQVKPFLIQIGIMPEKWINSKNKTMFSDEICIDLNVVKALREL